MPYIQVTLAEGRTTEQKQQLMTAITHAVEDAIGAALESIRVWIIDVPVEQMSVGGVPLDEVRRRRAAASQS